MLKSVAYCDPKVICSTAKPYANEAVLEVGQDVPLHVAQQMVKEGHAQELGKSGKPVNV